MSSVKLILILLFFSLRTYVYSQSVRLFGNILDEETLTPVSKVSIFTKDNKTGTLSTDKGIFSINIPNSKTNGYLYFTCIGYEADSLLISRIVSPLSIQLKPKIYSLKEIYVMPDSTLLTLLKKAYTKIPENYPNQPIRYEGFFQESTSQNDSLVELIEAVLTVYKESYTKTREMPGQIEIVKSRIKKLQETQWGFFGGAFSPIEEDIVLQRVNFIQPKKFKHYRYEFIGIKTFQDIECYAIDFHPLSKDSNNVQGSMLIDTKHLAYISFDIHAEHSENAKKFIGMTKPVESDEKVRYEQLNGKWHLKQISVKMKHESWHLKSPLYSSFDYITTCIQTDSVRPIPIERRLEYTDIIETKAENYNLKGWTDFDVLANENVEQLGFQFSTNEALFIYNSELPKRKISLAERIIKIAPKLTIGFGVSYRNISFAPISTSIRFQNSDMSLSNLPATHESPLIQGSIGYRITKKWRVYWQTSDDFFNKNISSNENSLGIEFRKNLNNTGYPIFLGTSLLLSNRGYYRSLGTYENLTPFTYNHKRFDSKELEFSYGMKEQVISPQISIAKRTSKFITMELYMNYSIPIHSEEDLRIKEKDGFFLLRKSTVIPFNDNPNTMKNNISITNLQIGFIIYLFR
ncbi:hypothetical protein AGMMS50262_07440 [Bacteroidia bacterium]|nr:hypothetical protein AGMMS50262_07440 [Bacteroidia bacterium]